jgi:large subunit ribosomal protein L21
MYAVIKVGGRQERVKPGDVIEVDLMKADPGDSVEFQPMVVFDDEGKAHVGKDLSRARVMARLVGDKKRDKVRVFKYRPKSGYQRSQGHRQVMTVLEVQEVALEPGKKDTKAAEEPAPEKTAAKKPASKKGTAKKTTAKKPAAAKKSTAGKSRVKKSTARKTSGRGST